MFSDEPKSDSMLKAALDLTLRQLSSPEGDAFIPQKTGSGNFIEDSQYDVPKISELLRLIGKLKLSKDLIPGQKNVRSQTLPFLTKRYAEFLGKREINKRYSEFIGKRSFNEGYKRFVEWLGK